MSEHAGSGSSAGSNPPAPPDDGFDFDAFMQEHAGSPQAGDATVPLPFDAAGGPSAAPQTQVLTDEPTATPIDGRTWMQIILGTEKRFAPLIGQLTDSTASIAGNTILIRLGENKIKTFINPAYLSKYVSEAALETLGRKYNIKVE